MIASTSLPAAELDETPVLELRGLTKTFGGTVALNDVSLTIARGEIHGLLGENGSGKSTLIKTLAGYHVPDAGELAVRGAAIGLPLRPGQFRSLGFEFVHQDLGLVPSMSVAENLWMGEIAAPRRAWHISWRAQRRRARELFAAYNVDLDPTALVGELTSVERAQLAIIRAVHECRLEAEVKRREGGALLVLDEPTVFLPKRGSERLFALLREIRSTGSSVLIVSHHLDEILEITDRVTVLRDGRRVGSGPTAQATQEGLVELILGRRPERVRRSASRRAARSVAARAVAVTGEIVRSVTFDLHHGEVVGMTGLVGSGFAEVPYLLFGARATGSGRLSIEDQELDVAAMTPRRAAGLGLALVPADRQRESGIPALPITDNVLMGELRSFFRQGVLRRRRMEREAERMMVEFDVRPVDASLPLAALSGGNQQKVVLAKWLGVGPRILLLDEPTQGVDIGSRLQIFELIRERARQGAAVLCASADYEQLATICDRVLIMNRGMLAHEVVGSEVTEERIAALCYEAMGSAAISVI